MQAKYFPSSFFGPCNTDQAAPKHKISITPQIHSKLVHTLLVVFEGSKVNVPQVAVFDKNMAVGKSENLVMLHVYKLEKDPATSF